MRVFYPMLAMVVLTLAVWVRMFFSRVGQMKRGRIHPQAVATSVQMAAQLSDTRAADNFRNLFELPVLFYAGVLAAALASQADTTIMVLAWLFVAFRVAHSAIHCTYNKVMHRFYAYVGGGIALFALWGVLGARLLSA